MIDINKQYQTKSGKDIFGLKIVEKTSGGFMATFPVKGSIDRGKGKAPRYQIWTLDGRTSIFGDSQDDLIKKT